jgi:hypothetical protein
MAMRRLTSIVSAAIAIWLTAGSALAQATPTPDAPAPELCQATAPSFAAITDIMATPQATASPTASPVPAGTPASEADIAAVTGVVRELIACFNAGEPLRAYGLYTDDYLRHLLSVQGVPNRAGYDLWAIPEPPHPDRYVQILAIREVKQLDGGGVRALVILRYAGIPVPKTFAFLFVETPDGWRINAFLGEINFSLP